MVRSDVGSPHKSFDEEGLSLVDDDQTAVPDSPMSFARSVNRVRNSVISSLRTKEGQKSAAMILLAFIVVIVGSHHLQSRGEASDPMMAFKKAAGSRSLSIATWNIAAINNNPFEYWITYDENPEYAKIMENIESFIESPGENDIPVNEVFTESMFSELEGRMNDAGWGQVRTFWEDDYKHRKIISQFMKDGQLGKKRLASMPDRITNTINVEDSNEPVCRPTVINMYGEDLSSLQKWWKSWESFMFDTPLSIKTPDGIVSKKPYEMLQPIKKAKYPAITENEEALSLPLQTMCGAIFDAILVHMMNTVSKPNVWQPLKRTMVESLNKKKVPHTLELLNNVYGNADIITLQEVSSSLIDEAMAGPLGEKYWISYPAALDAVRDQNSVVMLSKDTFPSGDDIIEITDLVYKSFPEGADVPVGNGDIHAISAVDKEGTPFAIASFHGDTNGLATIPVNNAIVKTLNGSTDLSNHKFIFGLDANTYEDAGEGKQDVLEWGESYQKLGLTSCWGDIPQKSNYTTFNARTYLQPQLNKACKSTEKRAKGDVNPKDFIVFRKGDFDVLKTWKDNTGERSFTENMAFPTLQFPSDHAVLATVL